MSGKWALCALFSQLKGDTFAERAQGGSWSPLGVAPGVNSSAPMHQIVQQKDATEYEKKGFEHTFSAGVAPGNAGEETNKEV